jgi:hypothetical protein
VPKETVALSTELGAHIAESEKRHLAAIELFFDEKRHTAERFFYEEWLPAFSRRYLETPDMAAILEVAASASSPADRLRAMTLVVESAQAVIAQEHRALLDGLNAQERRLLDTVRADYAQMRKMNDAITGLVSSASDVQRQNDAILQRFGTGTLDVTERLAVISESTGALADRAVNAEERLRRFREKLENRGRP